MTRTLNGTTDRIEALDDSIATLDFGLTRNVEFSANTFNGIGQNTINPVTLQFDQASVATTWSLDVSAYLPFGGRAREVTSVVTEGAIENASSSAVFAMPYVGTEQGTDGGQVTLTWPEPVRGRVHVTSRVDRPI